MTHPDGQHPLYYTSYRDFADWFASTVPAVTYHKLGPRPTGVRLKGLYVSAELFDRQLQEWRDAGFRSAQATVAGQPGNAGNPRRELVITFDDGFANVLTHGLPALARHQLHAVQFLVADRLGGMNDWEQNLTGEAPDRLMTEAEVRTWLAAGHEIGSHTCTHPQLTRVPGSVAREEIRASRLKLEDRFGVPIRSFCYPYGDWNPAVRDLVAEAGYAVAFTTEPGVPGAQPDRFALPRLTARYRSRNWAEFRRRLRALLRPGPQSRA